MRVLVPFGKGDKTSVAFVYEIVSEIDEDFEVKDILEIIDDRKLISDELIELAFFMSQKYMSPTQASLKQVLPPTNIKDIKTYYRSLVDEDNNLIKYLNKNRQLSEIIEKFGDIKDELDELIAGGKVKVSYDITNTQKISYVEYVRIINYKPDAISSSAHKQLEILNFLKNQDEISIRDLLRLTNSSRTSLNSLLDKGLIEIYKKELDKEIRTDVLSYAKFNFTPAQQVAYDKVISNPDGKFLLYGVTGSGKTEIFLQLVEELIKKGKEAIILVPEISLTPQTIERFKGRFNEKIAIMHSRLTPKERFNQWRMINNGEVKIAIGARSAIFAPFKNLGAIIIDEEHDDSYVSSKDPKYHTDAIANFRADYHKCNLILASATPSISSMKKALEGYYSLLHLKNRVNNTMPEIEIVDLKEELKNSNYSIISKRLEEEIRENLNNKEQSILFLNKIGHDSYTFCRSCGYVLKCDACDVAMTYHKNVNRLVCHYCGRTAPQPNVCPNCHSKKIKEFGAGTEKLEEEVRLLFPHANLMRMDSMTATDKNKYKMMYEGMKEGNIDILLGTQMIAKGLDFKNVTLVGIISADLSLNAGDFKSQENTFELLTQVAGRAGRDEKRGRVIIQSYRPENFVIQAVKNNDYSSYYKNELIEREAFSYPPFMNMITVKVVNESRQVTVELAKKFTDKLKENLKGKDKVIVIGPNPCKISRINNKHRYNILLKVGDEDLDFVIDLINKTRNEFIENDPTTSFIPALNPTTIN